MLARVAMLILFLSGSILAKTPAASAGPGLFGPGEPLDAAQVMDAPETLRARSAGLNLSVVEQIHQQLAAGQAAAAIPLNLFPDVQLTARFSRLEPSSGGEITLSGKIDGSPFSEIHLSQVGNAFFASLNTPQGLFRAASSDGNTARIWQVDPASFPREDEVMMVTTEAGTASVAPFKDGQATFTHPLAPALKGGGSIFSFVCGGMPPQTNENLPPRPFGRTPGVLPILGGRGQGDGGCQPANSVQTVLAGPSTVDDGSRIDVYVGYTTAAKNAAGGLDAMQALISTAMAETNTGYANSGILQRVNLVGSGEYAYNETNFDWNTTLDRWRNPADAVFGPAHALRDTNKADEMVLLVGNQNYCGLGFLMSPGFIIPAFSSYSFSLVAHNCATGYYSFAHEMGHNMGAMHNREAGGSGAYAYSYGSWIWIPADNRYSYRTVMAYDTYNAVDQNGTRLNYSAQRVNYWSNPLAFYIDQPTGKDISDPRSANNALTLNNTAALVAGFRDGPVPAAPAGLGAVRSGLAAITLNWTASGADLTRLHVERSPVSSESWAEIAALAPGVSTYVDAAFPTGTALRYRVLSDNGNGRSASPEARVAPAPPENLALTILGPYSVRLNWVNAGIGILNLYVERAALGAGTWTRLETLAPTSTTYTGPVPDGQAYRYRVLADNNEAVSSSSVVTLPAFPAVVGLAVTGLSLTSARLDWAAGPNTQDTFIIQRAPAVGAFVELASFTGPGATFTDSSLPANADYRYRVTARNGRGETISNPVNLPAAPGNFHPLYPAAPKMVSLAWVDNSTLETGHSLEISTNAGSSWTPLSSSATDAQAYAYDTIVCGLAAQYRLRAVSGAGQSAPLTTAAVTVPCQPMPTAVAGATALYLSWPDVAGETGYIVEESISPGEFQMVAQGSLPAGSTSFAMHNLPPGTPFRLRVKAVNAAGEIFSAEINATTTKNIDLYIPLLLR